MTGTVATVGTFDGVHRGHRAVLAEIVRRARTRGLASLIVTFDRHPLEVVNPPAAPRLLTLPDEKRALLAELGLDRIELLPFTGELARLAPEEFVRQVLRAGYGMGEGGRGRRYGGMMNQGPRPTFGIAARALEIHLFDFAGELYGEAVNVEWVRRLRDVQTFPSRDALVDQLGRDAVAARQALKK